MALNPSVPSRSSRGRSLCLLGYPTLQAKNVPPMDGNFLEHWPGVQPDQVLLFDAVHVQPLGPPFTVVGIPLPTLFVTSFLDVPVGLGAGVVIHLDVVSRPLGVRGLGQLPRSRGRGGTHPRWWRLPPWTAAAAGKG